MVYTYQIEGIALQTGDIICTMNGKPDILPGEFWRLVGRLVPGDVDHVAIYLGPDGRCVEAGARGVITFDIPNGSWNTERMALQRGLLFDTFYGIASPIDGLQVSEDEEFEMRSRVAAYCLAQVGKSYNLNFLNPETEDGFLLQPACLQGLPADRHRSEHRSRHGAAPRNERDHLPAGDLEWLSPPGGKTIWNSLNNLAFSQG